VGQFHLVTPLIVPLGHRPSANPFSFWNWLWAVPASPPIWTSSPPR